jgi:hypothetical protein
MKGTCNVSLANISHNDISCLGQNHLITIEQSGIEGLHNQANKWGIVKSDNCGIEQL